jgi:hypothetical protein
MADPADFVVDPRDERAHERGDDSLWNESWYFDFVTPDASLGGYARLGLYPNLGVAWYWACLVGTDRPLVIAVDHTVDLPPKGSLEVRAPVLWADHNCEEPLERWSLGLETHAVALDDPATAYAGSYGDRVPFGFDLEWETAGTPFAYPRFLERYEIPCRVHGEVLVGDETLEIDAVGQRDHSWGRRDWWSVGWCWTAFHLDDGSHWHAVTTKPSQASAFGYTQHPGGELDVYMDFTADEELGAADIPSSARLCANGVDVAFDPTGWAPILLEAPDGRRTRFPRGMGRFTRLPSSGDDAVDEAPTPGVGWIEFAQTPTG